MVHRAPLVRYLRRAQSGVALAPEGLVRMAARIQRPFLTRWMNGLLVRRDLVEDVLQDAQLQVWIHYRQCLADTDARVVAWLHAIARTTAIDALRQWTPEHAARILVCPIHERWDLRVNEHVDPPPFDLAPLFKHLESVFGPDALTLLWLRLVQGATWEEVGRELGVSWTAARRRYQRIIATSRRYILSYAAGDSGNGSAARIWLDRVQAGLLSQAGTRGDER